jgi:release factor glutamine methyltransferase
MQTVELLNRGIAELTEAGIPEAATDVQLLLGHCLNKTRTQLYLAASDQVSPAGEKLFMELLARRKRREPVAYILGEQEFWSLPFHVSGDVLIPRPETEFLLETAIKKIQADPPPAGSFLDLCCGSGIIAIVLALELRRRITALDLSLPALRVACRNAERHGVRDLIDFVQADLFAPLRPGHGFAAIVSNPPYVSAEEMRGGMQPEVVGYEPHLALDGGCKGLEVIEQIRLALPSVLCPGGYFFMEIGESQGAEVRKMFSCCNGHGDCFDPVEILADYAGRDRVLCARLRKK